MRELKFPFCFGLDTEEGFPSPGLIDFVDNKVDPTTGTIEVRGRRRTVRALRFRLPGPRPPAGQRAVQGIAGARYCVLTDQDKRYVMVLGKDTLCSAGTFPGRLLDDGMRVVLARRPGASRSRSRIGSSRWGCIGPGGRPWSRDATPSGPSERSGIPMTAKPLFHGTCRERTEGGAGRVDARRADAYARSLPCSPVSSSIGRSSPRCSRW